MFSTTSSASGQLRIDPADLSLPPTQPIDLTSLVAAGLAPLSGERPLQG